MCERSFIVCLPVVATVVLNLICAQFNPRRNSTETFWGKEEWGGGRKGGEEELPGWALNENWAFHLQRFADEGCTVHMLNLSRGDRELPWLGRKVVLKVLSKWWLLGFYRKHLLWRKTWQKTRVPINGNNYKYSNCLAIICCAKLACASCVCVGGLEAVVVGCCVVSSHLLYWEYIQDSWCDFHFFLVSPPSSTSPVSGAREGQRGGRADIK